ncbi:MAG: hypothetical protein LBE12_20970 [Planctomycetaceae bacterium]|nr:hypothetical protein [Planctomycetaceae bacterium]
MIFAPLQPVNSNQQYIDECGNKCNSQTEQNEQTRPRTWSESLPEIVYDNLVKLVFSVSSDIK